jgi:hypothetical protein
MIVLLLALLTWQAREPPRIAPPAAVTCSRDHLTAYTGRVTRYLRTAGRTTLTISTDWNTTEAVTLRHPGTDDPSRSFLIGGKPFTAADWSRIEEKKGTLKKDTRATAWVCDDGSPPVVDWETNPRPANLKPRT